MDKNNEQAPNNVPQEEQDGEQPDVDPVDNMDEEAAAKEKLTNDPSKVKFTSVNLDGYGGKNGEAKVDIHVVQTTVGMGKEELLKYANEPYWVRLRLILFVLFWLGWIAMLVGAVVIILLAPRCPPAPKLDWYQKTAIYQVEVEAFKDSDGDGIGDLKGLLSKVFYFNDLNVGTIMLSSIYATAPGSEGIVDFTAIDNRYGTMADFEELVAEIKKRDLKLIVEFNPNHSSDKHPWFQESVLGVEPYKDFYVWANSSGEFNLPDDKPNNWLSVTGGSAWEWNDKRQQFYLHTFSKEEPDLNLRNEYVRKELNDIMQFWLEKGVDGFKVVGASHLIEDKGLRDEPLITNRTVLNPQYKDRDHTHTVGLYENLGLFEEWRNLLTNFSSEVRKILLADLSESVNNSIRYYGEDTTPLVDFPINVQLTELNVESTGLDLKKHMDAWMNVIPGNAWPNWLLGNKKTKRLADRIGSELVDGMHMVSILARGTPITFYGDELAMEVGSNAPEKLSIMPWNNKLFGGFTNGSSTSLLLTPNYQVVNVVEQQGNLQSHLNIFTRLLNLRNQPAVHFGIQEYPVVTENIFSMLRVRKGSPGYLVVLNMANNSTLVDFSDTSSYLPETGRVEIRSNNIDKGPLTDGDHPKVKLNNILLEAKQSVVFSFVPRFAD